MACASHFTMNKNIILMVPAPKETLFHWSMSIPAVYMKNNVLSIDLSSSAQCSGLTQVNQRPVSTIIECCNNSLQSHGVQDLFLWKKAAKSGLMFRNHHVVEKSGEFKPHFMSIFV
jgi:hypothetical protein